MSGTIGRVLVLQSHRLPLPAPWLEPCIESVRAWAADRGHAYRFEDDTLLRRLPADLRRRTRDQPVVGADLARLAAIAAALDEGYGAVVWFDADTLVIDPAALHLPTDSYAVGREVWVQRDAHRWRAWVKVHNAFLLFRPGNPFLTFYRHAAERVVRAHQGLMVPQLVGPKLLTALHNVVNLPVAERAAMLSPAVARDLLAGGGAALALFRARSREAPASVNLCASLVGREIDAGAIVEVMERLRGDPAMLRPADPAFGAD